MPQPAPEGRAPSDPVGASVDHSRVAGYGFRAALLCSLFVAGGLAFLTVEDAFEPGTSLVAATVGVAALALVALLVLGVRDLRLAENRRDLALGELSHAESSERQRADHLANVLAASQSLRLAADGRVDYLHVLAAITPAGATSFLVRRAGGKGRVEAAHGPLAPMLVGRELPDEFGQGGEGIQSFHAGERELTNRAHLEGALDVASGVKSAIAIPLIAHDGRVMGGLHMLDPEETRILEPSFTALAQLVANQVAVAMANDDLLAHLRKQLVEVQRVQQQLVQASRLGAIGELAAAVAHEVNNPLTGILGFSELLLAELAPDDARRGEVEIIREEALRARAIVRSLLDFARPHSPQRMDADLSALARAAVDLVRYRAQELHIRIHEDYAQLPILELDPESFRQVILNLCTNAIEAMPDGGDLHIRTLATDDRVGVVIKDTGVGMDQTTRSRIFSPFLAPKSRGGYGTALGLSVSLNIVEGHRGSIEVESELGKGSTFTVWLPRTPLDPEALLREAAAGALAPVTPAASPGVPAMPATPVAAARVSGRVPQEVAV